ncbi:paraquat-inducible protein A [Glaciecola sp. 1036]|uniref:paraquat-inducible protein A n=1 Tax=Alteromonadaceae TaxID=72275 RepID=UPI003D016919
MTDKANYPQNTAASMGKKACHICYTINEGQTKSCKRCGTHVHVRRPQSVQKTIALLITAIILYIPANTYPIMVNTMLGQREPSTIIQGILAFMEHESYLVAGIIFTASIFIPIAKILIIFWLCYCTRKDSRLSENELTFMYKVTEFIGKWSMIDVFVVAILVALVHVSNIMVVEPGVAARAFACVVILTMLAAHQFDLRLIWDKQQKDM